MQEERDFAVGPSRSRSMRRTSFLATIWLIWNERNSRYFEGRLSSLDYLVEKIKIFVATWVSILPSFQDFSIGSILRSWDEIGFSSAPKAGGYSFWKPRLVVLSN